MFTNPLTIFEALVYGLAKYFDVYYGFDGGSSLYSPLLSPLGSVPIRPAGRFSRISFVSDPMYGVSCGNIMLPSPKIAMFFFVNFYTHFTS